MVFLGSKIHGQVPVPLDHFVSQVHLKRFGAAELSGRLHAIRKSDLKYIAPPSEDVCRIPDGSTNHYLSEPRIIEDFLKGIEPKYNRAVEKVLSGQIDQEAIFVIAGFISYVAVCSPTGMRLHADLLRNNLEFQAKSMEAENLFPPPPLELGEATITEMIDRGSLIVEVDRKYPQAIGITQIHEFIRMFGNSDWDFLLNNHEGCPFITSDYPIGLEAPSGTSAQNMIVPLTPKLAIRIHRSWELPSDTFDFSFRSFRFRTDRLQRSEVVAINRTLAMCADDLVFFPVFAEWVPKFMKKHAGYRIERRQQERWDHKGKFIIDSQVIAKITR